MCFKVYKLYNKTAIKWREFQEGVHRIINKTIIASKFGRSYLLELSDKDDKTYNVYTPREVTDYLLLNSPKFMKVINNNGVNQAKFA